MPSDILNSTSHFPKCRNNSIHELFTLSTATATRYLVAFLNGKLVVVSQLLPLSDEPGGADDDVFAPLQVNDLRSAVWIARVVDKTCRVTPHCGIDDLAIVHLAFHKNKCIKKRFVDENWVNFTLSFYVTLKFLLENQVIWKHEPNLITFCSTSI